MRDELLTLKAVQGHPNVVKCLGDDMLEDSQLPPPRPPSYSKHCLKLALAAGGDLFDRAFVSGTPLTIAGLHTYGVQMVASVQHIHSLGIAHLDIKPENFWLDADGTLMLAEFGLARRMPVNTIPGGTPQYAAPELTRYSAPLNGYAVDVWAAGVTLLMISISRNPFALTEFAPSADGDLHNRPAGRAVLTAVLRLTKAAQDAGRNGVLAACDYFTDKKGVNAFRELPEGLQKLLNGMLFVDPALRLTIQQVAEDPWLAVAPPLGPAAAAPEEGYLVELPSWMQL